MTLEWPNVERVVGRRGAPLASCTGASLGLGAAAHPPILHRRYQRLWKPPTRAGPPASPLASEPHPRETILSEDSPPTRDAATSTKPPADDPSQAGRRTAPNTCTVIHDRGNEELHFNRENIEKLLAGEGFFWLDLDQPDQNDYAILREVFKFHPLAVEDSEKFEQRAKLDEYDDFVFIVVYGAVPDDDRLVEVHCFYSDKFLVTVHRDECPAFTDVRQRYIKRQKAVDDPGRLLYRIIDALVDSFFPILADFDDRIDELENQTFLNASDAQLQEIFQMKRLLVGMRKAITPQRDMFAALSGGVAELPGMTDEDERYFRDIYDHLIRISDLIDTYRDLLTSSMDVYLSTVSNRLNSVMKQLTVMATVFLPLTFITGFFGQNFGWMVGHIKSGAVFVGLGIGVEVLTVAALFTLFKRRGWF
jgi:magnesium transporter